MSADPLPYVDGFYLPALLAAQLLVTQLLAPSIQGQWKRHAKLIPLNLADAAESCDRRGRVAAELAASRVDVRRGLPARKSVSGGLLRGSRAERLALVLVAMG